MINNVLHVNSNASNQPLGWGNLNDIPNTQEIADMTNELNINKNNKKIKKKRFNDTNFLIESFNNLDLASGLERQGNILNTENLILSIVGDE